MFYISLPRVQLLSHKKQILSFRRGYRVIGKESISFLGREHTRSEDVPVMPKLELGKAVEVEINKKKHYGIIKWIGVVKSFSNDELVGVQLVRYLYVS